MKEELKAELKAPYAYRQDFKVKYTGSCYCKAVQFEIAQDCLDSMYCHCETCQTLHGCPFQWAAVLPKDALQFQPDALQHLSWYHSPSKQMAHAVQDRTLPCKVSCNKCRAPLMDEGRNMMLMLPVYVDFPRAPQPATHTGSSASEDDARESHESETGRKEIPAAWKAKHHMHYSKRVVDMKDGLTKFLTRKGEGECNDEGNPIQNSNI
ncbi:Mss4-like protein [Protomyces lactucae-debilis]|uniref:Mss4-like protein n=1 Tax=Protomyces lactucae-debilis TaxID=2754530 RepID=A0A1Y2F3X2_PROLT|nr:Mss4-like protein [Protomyces lactucae-debilis]ORY78543.1 Mss4-like protein [Protomyces lactucae-debilis]